FLHCFLGRSRSLDAAGGVDEVRAVYRDLVAEGAHAAEGNLCYFKLRERRAQAGAAGRHTGSQESEVREYAAADGQGRDLLRADDLADLGLGRLNGLHFGGNDDFFALSRERQSNVNRRALSYGQYDPGLRVVRKPRDRNLELVATERQVGNGVEAAVVGRPRVGDIRRH